MNIITKAEIDIKDWGLGLIISFRERAIVLILGPIVMGASFKKRLN